ncbi:MAG: metal ABC transporter substrate-binding protein [Pseudomonadota bacterium]
MVALRQFVLLIVLLSLAPPVGATDFKVATTFTIIADMARQVAGANAEVISITKPGAEIHNYSPTPRDILRAQDADLLLFNGLNLELWFEKFFAHTPGVPRAIVSKGVTVIDIRGGNYDGKPNPHAWMSLAQAFIYIDNIRDALIEYDVEHEADYRANAEAYKKRLTDALQPWRTQIKAIAPASRWLVTSEGAFSYLAHDLNLREAFLWPINADQQGTPQQVRAVIDLIRAHEIPALFSESTVSPKPAQQIARETGARYGGVLYVDSLSEPEGPVPTYLDLMRVTYQTIAEGLRP